MSVNRNLLAFAALNGVLGVLVGAFAAHGAGPGVKALLSTGAQYQLVHAALAVACAVWGDRSAVLAGWLASVGGLVFCLALSLVAWLILPAMGMVAPAGGLLMIAGWVMLGVTALRRAKLD